MLTCIIRYHIDPRAETPYHYARVERSDPTLRQADRLLCAAEGSGRSPMNYDSPI